MPRPKASEPQRLRAYELWVQQFGPTAIHRALKAEFEEKEPVEEAERAVSLNTVKNWMQGFDRLSPGTVDLDSPFQWHRLAEYGLPWEASAFLLEVFRLHRRRESDLYAGYPTVERPPFYGPTAREARWCWRIHQALPDVPVDYVVNIADEIWQRDLASNLLGLPFDIDGIVAEWAYRPGDSVERRQEYDHDVAVRVIPTRPEPLDWGRSRVRG